MHTTKTNETRLRNEMLDALIAAPRDMRRSEPNGAAPRVGPVVFWSASSAAAAAAGLVARWATGGSRMALAASAGTLAAAAIGRWQLGRLFARRVPYVMERRVGPLEIRRFDRQICLETTIDAPSLDEAAHAAFPRLAAYIFGHGIPMTTPVVITRSDRAGSESLPERQVSEPSADQGRFTMRFFLPSERALAGLPVPTDARIHLRELAAHRSVALCFRGGALGQPIVQAERDLLAAARHALLTVRGEPMFAGFDAPTTLPFLRRNEVWVHLA